MNTILKLHGIDHRLKMFKKNWNRMKTILKLRKLYVKKVRKMLQLQLSLLARLSLRLALLYLPRRGPVAPRRPRPSPEATLSHWGHDLRKRSQPSSYVRRGHGIRLIPWWIALKKGEWYSVMAQILLKYFSVFHFFIFFSFCFHFVFISIWYPYIIQVMLHTYIDT